MARSIVSLTLAISLSVWRAGLRVKCVYIYGLLTSPFLSISISFLVLLLALLSLAVSLCSWSSLTDDLLQVSWAQQYTSSVSELLVYTPNKIKIFLSFPLFFLSLIPFTLLTNYISSLFWSLQIQLKTTLSLLCFNYRVLILCMHCNFSSNRWHFTLHLNNSIVCLQRFQWNNIFEYPEYFITSLLKNLCIFIERLAWYI